MLVAFHLVIGWIGMQYIQAELPRASHEQLLNDLAEGVLIVDEETTRLKFINKAAKLTCARIIPQQSTTKTTIYGSFEQVEFHIVDERMIKYASFEVDIDKAPVVSFA